MIAKRQQRPHGARIDGEHVAEQQRRRLRCVSREEVQEQQPEAEREREHDADGHVALGQPLAHEPMPMPAATVIATMPQSGATPTRTAPVAPVKPTWASAWPAKVCPRSTRK